MFSKTSPAKQNGTQYFGYKIQAERASLEALFGTPNMPTDSKVACGWVLESEEGSVVTLYHWKDNPSNIWNMGQQQKDGAEAQDLEMYVDLGHVAFD